MPIRRVILAGLVSAAIAGAFVAAQPPDSRTRQNPALRGDRRSFVAQLSQELARQAEYLAETSYDYFMGWTGSVTEAEQFILFKSQEFAAACRLFDRLLGDQTGYYGPSALRTNLYGASRYVGASFRELEQKMKLAGFQDDFNRLRRDGRRFDRRTPAHGAAPNARFGLAECRRIIARIEEEFARWR